MCGIAGLCNISGTPLAAAAANRVRSMTDKMVWRGPDGSGIWQSGPVCFGHRRLSIIDIAGGSQPMQSVDGRYCIVFNGEIYNFKALRARLAQSGIRFATSCDTEVIMGAYALYGPQCLDHLEGMFAFVLWDAEKKRLFCARDHFGKKPFYYSIQHGVFAFASELAALTDLGKSGDDFQFHADPAAIMRYLAYEYVPTPQCIYREVKILEPAHYLLLENDSLKRKRFWDLPAPLDKAPAGEPELCRELESLMQKAVARRMVSDVPLGVFLSGGIDSTIVAGLMAWQSTRPIQTFSIGFKEASYDESGYARIAARAYCTDHHERILSAEECADDLPGIVSKMDTPMADASCAPTWLLSGLAREHVTVALGGDGADELWAGYEHYIGFRIARIYNSLPAWVRKGIVEKLAQLLPASAGYVNPRLAVKTFLQGAASPDWLRVQTMLTAIGPHRQKEILNPQWLGQVTEKIDFLREETFFAPTRRQYDHWQDSSVSPLARAFHVYARQYMLDDILVKVDRCSMLHSLEVRAPFLDKNVAEFVARLPLDCKLRGFRRKYLLKKAFSGLLPPQILRRNKRGFQIPVAQWLRGRLKPLLLDLLNPERLKKQGLFRPDAIGQMLETHFSQKADLRKPLWTLLVLQIWLEKNRPQF